MSTTSTSTESKHAAGRNTEYGSSRLPIRGPCRQSVACRPPDYLLEQARNRDAEEIILWTLQCFTFPELMEILKQQTLHNIAQCDELLEKVRRQSPENCSGNRAQN